MPPTWTQEQLPDDPVPATPRIIDTRDAEESVKMMTAVRDAALNEIPIPLGSGPKITTISFQNGILTLLALATAVIIAPWVTLEDLFGRTISFIVISSILKNATSALLLLLLFRPPKLTVSKVMAASFLFSGAHVSVDLFLSIVLKIKNLVSLIGIVLWITSIIVYFLLISKHWIRTALPFLATALTSYCLDSWVLPFYLTTNPVLKIGIRTVVYPIVWNIVIFGTQFVTAPVFNDAFPHNLILIIPMIIYSTMCRLLTLGLDSLWIIAVVSFATSVLEALIRAVWSVVARSVSDKYEEGDGPERWKVFIAHDMMVDYIGIVASACIGALHYGVFDSTLSLLTILVGSVIQLCIEYLIDCIVSFRWTCFAQNIIKHDRCMRNMAVVASATLLATMMVTNAGNAIFRVFLPYNTFE